MTTILSIITALLVPTVAATRARKRPPGSWLTDSFALLPIVDQLLSVIPAVLATLALTYLAPAHILHADSKTSGSNIFTRMPPPH